MAELDLIGPSWSEMSQRERDARPAIQPATQGSDTPDDDLDDLLWYALTFRQSIRVEGLTAVTRRMGARPAVIALGARLDGSPESVAAITRGLGQQAERYDAKTDLDDLSARRVLGFARTLGTLSGPHREPATKSMARFLRDELNLAEGLSLRLLSKWNGDANQPPLSEPVLASLLARASSRRPAA